MTELKYETQAFENEWVMRNAFKIICHGFGTIIGTTIGMVDQIAGWITVDTDKLDNSTMHSHFNEAMQANLANQIVIW